VKYDANGNVVWAKSASAGWGHFAYSVAIDGAGNLYVAGGFQSPTATFGAITINNSDNSGNSNDVFIVKYNGNGNVIWAKSTGSVGNEYAIGNAADPAGNNYVTGYYQSATMTIGTKTLINAGSFDIFYAKYDSSGNVQWATGAGGNSFDAAVTVAADAFGNSYLGGEFQSASITFGANTLINAGEQGDLYLVKYDSAGNVAWAEHAGGTADDQILSVTT